MIKMALFDCASNEKCCSVDGGRSICPLLSSPPLGIWQLKSPHPREFAIQGKNNANAQGSARGGVGLGAGGIDWCITLRCAVNVTTSSLQNFPWRLQRWSYWREHLKYVWNVYCDVTNHRRDHHTTETTGNERFPICHGTNYFHFVLTFSLFTSKQLLFLPICLQYLL